MLLSAPEVFTTDGFIDGRDAGCYNLHPYDYLRLRAIYVFTS